ncbi:MULTISPECIES: hypothetical protein [Serratia]|uniref:hypothetical protein n=1 Tax=Serratia TaxID=613 RepID=UPI00066161E5|nr:hypothetical protein [Serratia sp. 506_PEND]
MTTPDVLREILPYALPILLQVIGGVTAGKWLIYRVLCQCDRLHPVRCLANDLIDAVEKHEKDGGPLFSTRIELDGGYNVFIYGPNTEIAPINGGYMVLMRGMFRRPGCQRP